MMHGQNKLFSEHFKIPHFNNSFFTIKKLKTPLEGNFCQENLSYDQIPGIFYRWILSIQKRLNASQCTLGKKKDQNYT